MTPSENLKRFQENADVDALLAYADATGHDVGEIRAALANIDSIFTALSYGEHPNFAVIDRAELQSYASGTALIAQAMVESDRSDLMNAGLQVTGLLDDPRLMNILSDALHSDVAWIRLSAIEALGRMSSIYSRPVLVAMEHHTDPVTRRAVAKAMGQLGS